MLNPYDNIPLMAFSTGNVDGLECVLLKIGIDQNQFSDPAAQGGSGRIRLYTGEGAAGAQFSASTPSATQLWGTGVDGGAPDIDQYDMVYFPCQGGEYTKTAAQQAPVINYANSGGRIFATHYSYVWFINPTPDVGDRGPTTPSSRPRPGTSTRPLRAIRRGSSTPASPVARRWRSGSRSPARRRRTRRCPSTPCATISPA